MSKDPKQISTQIDCVRREIDMRKRVYPSLVARGKKGQATADFEIESMQEALSTLIKAERAHLHLTCNQTFVWKAYPEHKPQPEQEYQDFFICYRNPHYINKLGFSNRVTPYRYTVLNWVQDSFCNPDHFDICAFADIPNYDA